MYISVLPFNIYLFFFLPMLCLFWLVDRVTDKTKNREFPFYSYKHGVQKKNGLRCLA